MPFFFFFKRLGIRIWSSKLISLHGDIHLLLRVAVFVLRGARVRKESCECTAGTKDSELF